MSANDSTVRPRVLGQHDTEPCEAPVTEPATTPWECSTWPAPIEGGRECLTDPCGELSPFEIALALRQPPLPAEYYELVGVDYEEVAA